MALAREREEDVVARPDVDVAENVPVPCERGVVAGPLEDRNRLLGDRRDLHGCSPGGREPVDRGQLEPGAQLGAPVRGSHRVVDCLGERRLGGDRIPGFGELDAELRQEPAPLRVSARQETGSPLKRTETRSLVPT